MPSRLECYALATTRRPRRHVLHLQRDGSSQAVCGARRVVYIGDPDGIEALDEAVQWPLCPDCKDRTSPEVWKYWEETSTGGT